MPKQFSTLFKKTSTGKTQYWSISTSDNKIITKYGQVDGKEQNTEDTIREGKNIGKSNETSPQEQAEAEALSKWERQIKKGYVENLDRAENGENDFKGGYSVMLAHKFSEQGHKITYPAYAQPKLDGHRCGAIIDNGVCTLWSRTRKQIFSAPHIVEELQQLYPTGLHMIDGELYNHAYKANFEELSSIIRQEVPAANCTEIHYYVYDKNVSGPFSQRIAELNGNIHGYEKAKALLKYVVFVNTVRVNSEEELINSFDTYLKLGYEGEMVRNAAGLYLGKRSYDLQKIKEFEDDEFPIIGIEEGNGHLQGHAIFVCQTHDGKQFKAKMRGDISRLKEFFNDHSLWKDKTLTVKYQGYTVYGIPRFPVGERFRQDV